MSDFLTLLPVRLLASVPEAAGMALLVVCACAVLRLRDPRLRALLTAFALLDVLLVVVGLPVGGFVAARVSVSPLVADELLRSVRGPALIAWTSIASVLVGARWLRSWRMGKRVRALLRWFPAPPQLVEQVTQCALRARVASPDVAFVPGNGSPFISAGRRPVLVLPQELWLDTTDPRARCAMILHELAHVQQRHGVLRWALGLLRDVFFFNPFVSVLVRRLETELEPWADQRAIEFGAAAAGLANALVRASSAGRASRSASVLALGDSFRNVRARIDLLRRRPSRRVVVAQCAVLLLLLPWTWPGDGASRVERTTLPGGTNGEVAIALSWSPNPVLEPVLAPWLPASSLFTPQPPRPTSR